MNTTTARDATTHPELDATGFDRPVRRHEDWLARLRSNSLDTELAAGLAPAGRRLRTVRAGQLRREREALARAWTAALDDATSGAVHWNRVPLNRHAVVAETALIRDVVDELRAPTAPVRALALSHLLLTDGTGPLYRRGDLAAALLGVLQAFGDAA